MENITKSISNQDLVITHGKKTVWANSLRECIRNITTITFNTLWITSYKLTMVFLSHAELQELCMCCFAYVKFTLNPPMSPSHREDQAILIVKWKYWRILALLFSQLLLNKKVQYTGTMPSISNASKELWCFNCNSMRIVCLHDSCPEHCDLCLRIKAIIMKSSL